MIQVMKKRSQLPVSERPEKKAMAGQLRTMSDRDLLVLRAELKLSSFAEFLS
jgi:hypothetical protein